MPYRPQIPRRRISLPTPHSTAVSCPPMTQHIVITGASSGIGEALAKELGRTDVKLTLVARRKDLLDKLAAEIGPHCRVIAHDLASSDEAHTFIPDAEAAFGPIDVLVNNAGMENTGATALADIETAKK